MSFLRVTNIQDLNGNNTVAITSASSGNLIVKNELIGEGNGSFTGIVTASSFAGVGTDKSVTIEISGSNLIFSVAGIGSTSLTLS